MTHDAEDFAYLAARGFALALLKSSDLSFQVVWDALAPHLRVVTLRQGKLTINRSQLFAAAGLSADRSKLLIAVATATFASALNEVCNQDSVPDSDRIRTIIRSCAQEFRAPRGLVLKMENYLPEFIQRVNFYESVRGKTRTERDVWISGLGPKTVAEEQVDSILSREKPDLIVDEDTWTVRVPDGHFVNGISRSNFDLLVWVLKADGGFCSYEKLFEALRKKHDGKTEHLKVRLRERVSELNAALNTAGFPKDLIKAKPKEGYGVSPAYKFCVLGIPRYTTR